jgi:hypothetical protein
METEKGRTAATPSQRDLRRSLCLSAAGMGTTLLSGAIPACMGFMSFFAPMGSPFGLTAVGLSLAGAAMAWGFRSEPEKFRTAAWAVSCLGAAVGTLLFAVNAFGSLFGFFALRAF